MASADLASTQRWMLAAIVGDAAAQAADAPPEAVVAGSQRLPARERLDVYRRGYRMRLVGCLRELHPGLRHALGDEVFEAFALDYLGAHPPRGHTLGSLGSRWPEHLAATRPADEGWPDFLIDLARLERAFNDVYDGPGIEDRPAGTTIEPAPCLRLLRTRYPVAGYLAAVRRGETPDPPAPRASFVAVSRRDWVVTMTELDEAEHEALARLVEGVETAEARRRAHGWARRGFLRSRGSTEVAR